MVLPGLRGGDHIGITVPDIEAATQWFVDVLGAEVFYTVGPFSSDDDWMQDNLAVHPRAVLKALRMLRIGLGLNLELFEYEAPDQNQATPKNSDIGGFHVALYVDDMSAAVAALRARGVRFLGEPKTIESGPSAGLTWCYFNAPWGLQLELVSYPSGKAYEQGRSRVLWSPKNPAV